MKVLFIIYLIMVIIETINDLILDEINLKNKLIDIVLLILISISM